MKSVRYLMMATALLLVVLFSGCKKAQEETSNPEGTAVKKTHTHLEGASHTRDKTNPDSLPHNEDTPPASKTDVDEERKLYLTAAGLYTTEDIKANGNKIGSEKFKGFKASHDIKPKVGDKICPVTLTKSNPKCTWIIGGKTYEFCCPPCVEEFVKLAKEDPSAIKQPEEYIKK